ncbi:polyprenyl synthetase [Candidatus Omnitrophus magneticus]|uniref:Polyprenyl synthetase n=1 Tax=Candidatus Omnitrophus magneticus TaxID=1609969 RepID=A0A0F0CX98_9BACT|nr:polyprenyl synthetase [Candidatus Omnitrophus magneticus]
MEIYCAGLIFGDFLVIDILKKEISREIKESFDSLEKKYCLKSASPLLYFVIKDFFGRKGKRIRPLLFILSYLGYSFEKKSYKDVLKPAIAFEFLHAFLLIHDDIIDESELRRGKPTLHKVINSRIKISKHDRLGGYLGIVAGDIIFAMAVELFISFKTSCEKKETALREFISSAIWTGEGEFIDVFNGKKTLDKVIDQDIYRTYELKTSVYTFLAPLSAGAIIAGAGPSEIKLLKKFGSVLGRAFQILDDFLDIFMTEEETGKSKFQDFSEKKKTFLAWKTYHSLKGRDKKIFFNLFEKDDKSIEACEKIKDMIIKSGAAFFILDMIDGLIKESLVLLSRLKIKKEYKVYFAELIEKLSSQTFAVTRKL